MTTRNLIVVAHPDDEILGFGATGAKLASAGETVQPVILCGDVDVRNMRPHDSELAMDIDAANKIVGFEPPCLGEFPNIRMNTVPHIELVKFIEKAIVENTPQRIFTHHPADLNDDHRQVSRACLVAFRLFQRRDELQPVNSLHFMEIQSATDWALDPTLAAFRANLYIEVTNQLDTKMLALACYRNIIRDYPHPRSEEAIRGLAAYRGGQSGLFYAEAFETVFQRELG